MKTTITVTAPGGDHYTVTVEDDDGSSVFEVTATADDLALRPRRPDRGAG